MGRRLRFVPAYRGHHNFAEVGMAADEEDAYKQLRAIKARAAREVMAQRQANRPKPSMPKFNLPPLLPGEE